MKAEDLMIGDWVSYNGTAITVENIHDDCINFIHDIPYVQEEYMISSVDIEPIKLTAEILEKNGFERDDTDTVYDSFTIDKIGTDENYEIIIKWCDSYDNGAADAFNRVSYKEQWSLHAMRNCKSIDIEPTGCIYVHELQHILKLLNIDKEIEL